MILVAEDQLARGKGLPVVVIVANRGHRRLQPLFNLVRLYQEVKWAYVFVYVLLINQIAITANLPAIMIGALPLLNRTLDAKH